MNLLVVGDFLLLTEALHAEVSLTVNAAGIFSCELARGSRTERIDRRSFLSVKLSASIHRKPSSHMARFFWPNRVIKSLRLEENVFVFVQLASHQLLLKLSLSAVLC